MMFMKNTSDVIAIYSRKSKFTGKGESIGNQVELCREYIRTHYGDEAAEKAVVFEDATDIIGLKQNPTNGRRFSPIFSFIGHFSIQNEEMLTPYRTKIGMDGSPQITKRGQRKLPFPTITTHGAADALTNMFAHRLTPVLSIYSSIVSVRNRRLQKRKSRLCSKN